MAALWPEARVPRTQGNGVVHAPVVLTNVRPDGVTSATVTPEASLGPVFVTTTV
jgi:hypothetical protein